MKLSLSSREISGLTVHGFLGEAKVAVVTGGTTTQVCVQVGTLEIAADIIETINRFKGKGSVYWAEIEAEPSRFCFYGRSGSGDIARRWRFK